MTYQIINIRTQAVVGQGTNLRRLRSRRDRLDMDYGAAVHVIKEVK